MNQHAPVIRKGRKFDQVLDGARKVFMSDGFEGASVDDIAKVAGVSKATLYSYFPDKRLLFLEVANAECQRQAQTAIEMVNTDAPPRDVLTAAGRHFLTFITSSLGQQIFRTFVAESGRFPEVGRQFYLTGPNVMREELVDYIRMAADRGELEISDPYIAADQFAELCKSEVWIRRLLGVIDEVPQEDIFRIIDEAVETFLARYGATPA